MAIRPFWGKNMNAVFQYLDSMGYSEYGSMSASGFADWVDELLRIKSDHSKEPEDWAVEVLQKLRETGVNASR